MSGLSGQSTGDTPPPPGGAVLPGAGRQSMSSERGDVERRSTSGDVGTASLVAGSGGGGVELPPPVPLAGAVTSSSMDSS